MFASNFVLIFASFPTMKVGLITAQELWIRNMWILTGNVICFMPFFPCTDFEQIYEVHFNLHSVAASGSYLMSAITND